jgi:HPt (histidine-containing phosphotransfer) domain-containing protein
LEKLIDLQNLMVLSRQNLSFVREILEVYLANTPRDMDALQERVDESDWEQVRYYAHKLKSSSFTIGFDEGYKIYKEMETLIKDEEDTSGMPALMDRAAQLCDQAIVEVKIRMAELA